ncbi:hypothetical protein [Halalkalibacillus halophilus]|uniref:hypothetical protein n=1 Tax=Halalkalibacillus halophilus TaxID=392827 RepID=UPI0004114560|nr:hypothetical protein [Halalkalibacillus halophilus]
MAKKYIVSSVVAAVTGLVAYLMVDENRRSETKNNLIKAKQKLTGEKDLPIDQAGKPEIDQLENADMVSEGSQFGVQYYNEVKSEDGERTT